MPLNKVSIISPQDLESFSWRGLKRFQDASHLKELLIKRHNIPKSHWKNAEKQAIQIKFCLQQAKEYHDAAMAVTSATSPTLLYYSVMSLALAEILFKQDGNSSLDIARGENKHHGLLFKIKAKLTGDALVDARQLFAEPMLTNSGWKGTFSLWHRTAECSPIVGKFENKPESEVGNLSYQILLGHASPKRLANLPASGLSLLECFSYVPRLYHFLPLPNEERRMVRGKVEMMRWERAGTVNSILSAIVHPAPGELCDAVCEFVRVPPGAYSDVDVTRGPNGQGLIITYKELNIRQFAGGTYPYDGHFPDGFCTKADEVYFLLNEHQLNEFGYLYAGLFICGNLSRYYPDLWIEQLLGNSHFSIVVEQFLDIARERIPTLMLNELTSTMHLPEP